jgi:hypothetical protein
MSCSLLQATVLWVLFHLVSFCTAFLPSALVVSLQTSRLPLQSARRLDDCARMLMVGRRCGCAPCGRRCGCARVGEQAGGCVCDSINPHSPGGWFGRLVVWSLPFYRQQWRRVITSSEYIWRERCKGQWGHVQGNGMSGSWREAHKLLTQGTAIANKTGVGEALSYLDTFGSVTSPY